MTNPALRYYHSIAGAESLSSYDRVDLFAYFLQSEMGQGCFTASDIARCFQDCSLKAPSSLAQYLSKGVSAKSPKFLKVQKGYVLEYHTMTKITSSIGVETHIVQIPKELRQLEAKIPDGHGKDWLVEGIDCFGASAFRATIIMVWIFVLDHLFEYVIAHGLAQFNVAMASHPDQKAMKKVGVVSNRDHLTLLGEEVFIELCRSAKIISPDVRKILIEKLGIRNSAAHPSGIKITRHRAVGFTEDLVLNVVLKYQI